MKKYLIIIVSLFLCFICNGQTSSDLITKQRAIFIINTANQFKWGDNFSDKKTFKIAILGDEMLYKEVQALSSSRKVNQLKLEPKFYINLPTSANYDLVYANKNLGYNAFEIISIINKKKKLFIGENYKFNECFVNLIFLNEEFIYEINENRLLAHDFSVSNSLKDASVSSSSKWYELFLASQNNLSVVTKEVKKQQITIDTQLEKLDSLSKSVYSLEDRLSQLNTEVISKEKKISWLQYRKRSLQEDLLSEKIKIDSLIYQIDSTKRVINDQSKTSKKLSKEINSQKSEISTLSQSIDVLKTDVKIKREEIESINQELSIQKRNNILLISLVIAFLIIATLLFFSNKLRKKNYTLLQEKNKFIEERRKEMEQFAFAASHDLQDPLNTSIGFGMLLKDRSASTLSEEDNIYLDQIIHASERMKSLIKDLLEYSRIGIEGDTNETFSIKEVMEEVLIDIQPKIHESKAIITTNNYSDFSLQAKKSEIRRAISNLISNSLKYQPVNQVPKIEIDITHTKEQQKIKALVKIKDNGIGIEDQFKDKVFDVFRRLHNTEEYEGTGIGLANCKKIIERYNGRIWIEDNPEGGSVFVFYIYC